MKKINAVAFIGCFLGAALQIGCGTSQTSGSGLTGSPVLTYKVTDSCNDGRTVYYRFFDETDNLTWPTASTYYYATQGNTYTSSLQCKAGASICFGASENTVTDSPFWGVGSNNSHTCANCCVTCQSSTVTGTLSCATSTSGIRQSQGDLVPPSLERKPMVLEQLDPDK
jgi:hypothetical protein